MQIAPLCKGHPMRGRVIKTVLLFLFCLHTSTKIFSQTVSFSGKNVPLIKVLSSVEKQTGYVFLHDGNLLKGSNPVSIEVSRIDLKSFLQQILKDQPLEYTIESKTIILRKKDATAPQTAVPLIVRGYVTDIAGTPLIGVSVRIKDSKIGTVSDITGSFTLRDVSENAVLVFSFIGFVSQEMPVNGRSNIYLKMTASVNKLDETVVQAYGTTSRRYNTGNISKVTREDIVNQPVENPLAALEGRVPGMIVTQSSGVPGASFKVEIRGRAAFDRNLSDDQPLFIIDGVPMAANNTKLNKLGSSLGVLLNSGISPFNSININDIESVEVLKDADATAIYGSRGANGVIIITTRKGVAGKTRLSANVYTGISKVTRTTKMMNTKEYLQMRREAFANSGTTMTNSNAYDVLLWDTTRYTDFTKLLIGGTATTTDADASVSGGNTNTQYLVGGGYHRQTTVYPGDASEQRGSMHFNISSRSNDQRFSMNFSGNYSVDENNLFSADLATAISLPPNFQVYDSSGKYAWNEKGIISSDNPLASLLNRHYTATTNSLLSNMLLGYRILRNLEIRSSFGYSSMQTNEFRTTPRSSQNPARATTGAAQYGNNQYRSWIIEPQAEYNAKVGQGRLNVLAGATFNSIANSGSTISALGYTSDELLGTLAAAGANGITISNASSLYRYQAFFGRINYNLKNTYILNISGRRDGSSRFGPSFRFSNFGAVGAAWLFTNESFMQSQKVLSYGKLRSSYGVTGNDKIGEYKYLDSWKATSNTYADSSTLYPTLLYNPALHWEKNKKLEVAVEMGFLKDKVLTTIALYRNASSDPLVSYPLPAATGFTTITANLNGVLILNTGIELTIGTTNIKTKHFTWTTNFNMTVPKNQLKKYPNLANSSYATSYKLGQSLNTVYGAQFTGVDSATGLYTVKDVNKDNLVNSADYTSVAKKDATLYGGLQNTFNYKGLSLSFFLQFVKQTGLNYRGNGLYNPPGSMYNMPTIVMDRWQKPGDKTDVQKYMLTPGTISGTSGYYAMSFSNAIYTDASFVRLKNVSISYSLPADWLKKAKVTNCRFFINAQNLATFTHFKGADPETQNYLYMPPLLTISGGLQFNI